MVPSAWRMCASVTAAAWQNVAMDLMTQIAAWITRRAAPSCAVCAAPVGDGEQTCSASCEAEWIDMNAR